VFVKLHKLRVQDFGHKHVKVLALVLREYNIFWFEVCVDYIANSMQVVKTHECLLCNFANDWDRNAIVIELFNHREKIFAENFKSHDRVFSIWPDVEKLVEHLQVV